MLSQSPLKRAGTLACWSWVVMPVVNKAATLTVERKQTKIKCLESFLGGQARQPNTDLCAHISLAAVVE